MQVIVELSTDQAATALEAASAEDSGFDGVAVGEHLFFHGSVPNSLVTLAAAAGATTSIRLLSALAVVPLYQPAVLAKLATSLDVISCGRFDFGVGAGGEFPSEFVAAGVNITTRGRKFTETLELLEAIWAGGPLDFRGEFAEIPGLELNPPVAQPGGPPIWVGGRKPVAMRRAGRFAKVWMPYMFTPQQLEDSLVQVRDHAASKGRRRADVKGAIYIGGHVHRVSSVARARAVTHMNDVYQQDFDSLADRYLLHGDPDKVIERAASYAAAGAECLVFSPAASGAERDACLKLFTDEVLPELKTFSPAG